MVIFYPKMFLSGEGMPSEMLPDTIKRVADFLPLTYVVQLMRSFWFGEALSYHWLSTGVLAGIILDVGLLAARIFAGSEQRKPSPKLDDML